MTSLRVAARLIVFVLATCATVEAQTTRDNPFDRDKSGNSDSPASQPASRPSGPTSRPQPAAPKTVETNPAAVAVVEKYLDSIGGREALLAIQDRQEEVLSLKFSPTDVVELQISRAMKRPLMLREDWELDVQMPGSDDKLAISQMFDGKRGFTRILGVVEEMVGQSLTNFVWDKAIDDRFLHWQSDGYKLLMGPEGEVAGVPADCVITVPFVGDTRVHYYFAKDSGRLLKREWIDRTTQRRPVRKEEIYDEYTEIPVAGTEDRVAIPLVKKTFEDGELSLEQQYESIKFNTGIPADRFGRPDGKNFEEHKKGLEDKRKEEEAADTQPGSATSQPKAPSSQPKAPASQPKKQ